MAIAKKSLPLALFQPLRTGAVPVLLADMVAGAGGNADTRAALPVDARFVRITPHLHGACAAAAVVLATHLVEAGWCAVRLLLLFLFPPFLAGGILYARAQEGGQGAADERANEDAARR